MNNFNIDKSDLEQIEALLRNNTNIERLYKKLCNLELEDKKDTEEYTKLLNYLSIVIEAEDKIYKESNLTIERILSWLKFLKQTKDQSNPIIIRINSYLFESIVKKYNQLINLPERELLNILTMSGIKLTTKNASKEQICKCIMIKETIQKDISHTFISFLQESINNPTQKIFKEQLTVSKYEAIFLNKDIESFALKHNLNLPNNPYIISNFMKDLLELESNIYNNIKYLLCSKIVLNEIYNLLETSDSDYTDIQQAGTSVIRQCMIKSCLSLMSDKGVTDVNYSFQEFIEDKEYETVYPNSNVSEKIITNCFKNIKTDKAKIRTLSLK